MACMLTRNSLVATSQVYNISVSWVVHGTEVSFRLLCQHMLAWSKLVTTLGARVSPSHTDTASCNTLLTPSVVLLLQVGDACVE